VWSVWPETLDVYLGRRLTMLRVGNGEPAVIRMADATVPLAQVFEKLASASAKLAPSHGKARKRLVRVALSSGLCPGIGFGVPTGMHTTGELKALTHAAVAAQLGVASEHVITSADPGAAGVAAVSLQDVFQGLNNWAISVRARLVSVMPLWSMASECAAARERLVRGLWLTEPDAVTWIAQDTHGGFSVQTKLVSEQANADSTAGLTWLRGLSLNEGNVLKLGFEATPAAEILGAPRAWSLHWRRQ
jgi:hypothetical protein